MRNDIFKIEKKLHKSFLWRNFSPMQRKDGKDMDLYLGMSFIMFAGIMIVGYPRTGPDLNWIWEMFV